MRFILTVCILLLLNSQTVLARNISVEQTEAANARDAVGDTMSALNDLSQKIAAQEKLIAREQAQLQQYQAEKQRLEKELAQRKTVFEQKSKALDDAWKQRNEY